jgi:signal transduction histidine kinase
VIDQGKSLKETIARSQRFLGISLLLIISLIFATKSYNQMMSDWEQKVSVMTRVVSKNIISSIQFSDKDTATNILKTLDGESDTVSAILYDSNEQVFAMYLKDKNQIITDKEIPRFEKFVLNLEEQLFSFYYPIKYQSEVIGTLVINTSVGRLINFFYNYIFLLVALYIFIMLYILVISTKTKKKLTGPIDLLLEFFDEMKKSSNYEKRLPSKINEYNSIKEFHKVGLSFNEMFEKVDEQNKVISKANDNLEDLVNIRTKELDQERSKLIQAGKMSSLGEMASGIAHEINNPLAIIGSHIHLIKKLKDSEKLTDQKLELFLEKITSTLFRIEAIIAGLKTFSRDSSKEGMKSVNIKALLNDTLQFCSQRFKSGGVELIIEDFSENTVIECNATQISQVLLNLFNNSYDAIYNYKAPWVKLSIRELDKSIHIIISDCGDGIPLDIQEKILQPFFTTKEIGKGTGLGLSISIGILEAHQGKLYIEKKSKNTMFILEIPMRQQKTLG